MNVVLESLAGCLSERIMENDGKGNDVAEPRLSYLRSSTYLPTLSLYHRLRLSSCVVACTAASRGKFSRRASSDMELDEYPTFRSSASFSKTQRR
jgi:hypothetical protein